MLKKPLMVATTVAAMAAATLSTQALAGDPVLGALIGGGIGAAIGNGVSGHRDARIVGGVLGAIVGSSIAANSGGYYDDGYYAPSAGYYGPAPVYYGPSVVYSSRPVYVRGYPRYATYGRGYAPDRRDWRGYDRHR